LQHALVLAEPEGYVRMFLDEGSSMMDLLREASVRKIMPRQGLPNYTDKLLAAFETEQKRSAGESPLPDWQSQPRTGGATQVSSLILQPLIEPLSHRELDVLRLFKTELSGPEIAHELVISLSTVRTHTKRIYSKLNVNNRRAAVKRATELDLI